MYSESSPQQRLKKSEVLSHFVTQERLEKIHRVIESRTRSIVPVLEGIYDGGNLNAVVRSAESFGVLDLHVVSNQPHVKAANRVTQGADKWINFHRWNSTELCLKKLKTEGYQILVTALSPHARTLDTYSFDRPTAIVFGNEREGCSQEAIQNADHLVKIPMLGFSQSFNISVAAALALYHIYLDRMQKLGRQGDLLPHEKETLRLHYLMQSVERAEEILRAKGFEGNSTTYLPRATTQVIPLPADSI